MEGRDSEGRFIKGKQGMKGKNNPMFGKENKWGHHSKEAKEKISLANKGKLCKMKGLHYSEEIKRKLNLVRIKNMKNNPDYGFRGKHHTEEFKKKIGKIHKGKIVSKETKRKMKIARSNQVFPIKDTKIELKIQDFLTLLKIEFLTHKYMNIKNGYQCDIFIPKQKGINQKTIIECDGDFFHCNPNKYSEDFVRFKNSKKLKTAKDIWERDEVRTKELQEKGFKVIRLWGHEIKVMEVNELRNKIFA